MGSASRIHLFQAYGVELEYMIVDSATLAVRPITDEVMRAVAGQYQAEVDLGEVSWSNELALHVIELKTNGPSPVLEPLPARFQEHVRQVNRQLEPFQARLMPTAMHPWMDPHAELKLWPHEYNPVYEAYNRIFNCQGHGWANLQSVHLNLPFADDAEFGRLHAGIRVVLPLLPALAASSPVMERRLTGLQDNRMDVYRHNSRRVPSLTAQVVPEPVFTAADYEREILQAMYREIRPLDPEGILQFEWLNSRGAIARFDRGAIEIRVLDVQECPEADVAICAAAAATLQALAAERWCSLAEQQSLDTALLSSMLLDVIRDADATVLRDRRYLSLFGYPGERATAAELWRHILHQVLPEESPWRPPLEVILTQGPLSRRIAHALEGKFHEPRTLEDVYRTLCDCLQEGRQFRGE